MVALVSVMVVVSIYSMEMRGTIRLIFYVLELPFVCMVVVIYFSTGLFQDWYNLYIRT